MTAQWLATFKMVEDGPELFVPKMREGGSGAERSDKVKLFPEKMEQRLTTALRRCEAKREIVYTAKVLRRLNACPAMVVAMAGWF